MRPAQFYLAYSYLTGTGVARDSVAGYQWLYLAGKQDPQNKDYQVRLAGLEARIGAVLMARGKVLALEWLKRRGT
jgi:TPR repeat protein